MGELSISALEERVAVLEKKRYNCPNHVPVVDEHMKRAREDVEQLKLYSACWKWVPSDYYNWTLLERAKLLGVPSTEYLCKALLMENRKVELSEAGADPTNPKFLFIMIQYEATLDVTKLKNVIRKLRTNVKERLEDNQFDFRIASIEDNRLITGYEHNSVTPFGLPVYEKQKNIPIILCEPITKLPKQYFYMGGGHVDLKLRLSISDFVKAKSPIIADISQPRITTESTVVDTTELTNNETPTGDENQQNKTNNKKNENKQKKQQQKQQQNTDVDYTISALDIRVGKIIKVWNHEEADKLYCEEIDLGNGEIRTIASGLRNFYKLEDMENRMVLVLCNLKKRNLVGFPSHGMVLCASNSDHTQVEFVSPPSNAIIGERIIFNPYSDNGNVQPEVENKIAKKKIFEKVAPDLKTNSDGIVVWKDSTATTLTSQGSITCNLKDAQVS